MVVTHGINVKAYAEMAFDQFRESVDYNRNERVIIPDVVDYTGVALTTIRKQSIRLSIGGTARHLEKNAAEEYLEKMSEKVQNEKNKVSENTNEKE